MSARNATGGGEGFAIIIGLLVAFVLLALTFWIVGLVIAIASILPWVRAVWNERSPGQTGHHLRDWLAPHYHYPFVGIGSVLASVAGAVAVLALVSGSELVLPLLILVLVLARSLSMAFFPWPRSEPRGLGVYPLVAITGPVATALGVLAVLLLIHGGQMLNRTHPPTWSALSMGPLAIAVILVATMVGRVGRLITPSSVGRRRNASDVLTPEAVELGTARAMGTSPVLGYAQSRSLRGPLAGRGAGDVTSQ